MGYWGLNSWFVHVRKALYQLTRLHFQPTPHKLEVAGSLPCCMGGMEVGRGSGGSLGKGEGFISYFRLSFWKKNNGVFRKGRWLNRNEAIKDLDPIVPPVTCMATMPPVPSCTREDAIITW